MINLVRQTNLLFNKNAQLWLGFFILLLFFGGCKKQVKEYAIYGNTMGTTYSVKVVDYFQQPFDINSIKGQIDATLQIVNQQMSTYIPDSEISRFNSLISKEWLFVSKDFYDVIVIAQEVSRLTDGAFDITVGPIVDLWGFSGDMVQNAWRPPSKKDIEETIKSIGFNNISVGKNSIKKVNPDTKIDLNAIAKGYGVDVVFELLQDLGFTDILVEIGGEVRCLGHNKDGNPWKIGIDKPILALYSGTDLQEIIALDNNSLATSGDYRNYFEYNGELFSHIIDPRIGCPTQNQVASVSVIAPNCIIADALATALMVMGTDGIELINSMDDIETMLILRTGENNYKIIESSGWKDVN